jgi:FolB domain-containing protein
MSDLIRIVDLEVHAHIGVPDEERAHAQKLLVSIEMGVDSFSHAAATDSIAKTVNYFEVAQHVKHFVKAHTRKLLETLIEELAHDLLKHFPIRAITIEIKKFILPDAKHVSVKIERHRGN